MAEQPENPPIVFIDDAHTLGGTQIALAWTIQVVLTKTEIPVLCVCTVRTRRAVEAVTGVNSRLQFEEAPSALPLNLFCFPIRLPAYWFILRRLRNRGVRAWWLNLADIEFGLAPLLVLRAMGETTHSYIHGTGQFSLFYQAASRKRRLLSYVRDAISNKFVFRLHSCLVAASRSSQKELESRITSRKRPSIGYLYYPPIGIFASQLRRPVARDQTLPLQLWMIGNVIQGHKNNLLLLDLLEHLAQIGHTPTLGVAGVGPDLQTFQREADRRGLAERITYFGWVADPCAMVPKQAIIVIPSFHETMNLVAREAMRYGLGLVVSPIPVFHEWIPPALIAADFSPAAFATRICELNRRSGDELAEMYRRALNQFSDDIFLKDLLRISSISQASL